MYFVTGFFAGIVPDCNPVDCTTEDLLELVVNVINFLITISLVVATLFLVWGGFVFLTSGGSPERISSGKKTITAAIIGIVIVLASVFLINVFLTTFTKCEMNFDTISIVSIKGICN